MVFMPGWILGGAAAGIPKVVKEFGSNLHNIVDIIITWPTLLLGLGVQTVSLYSGLMTLGVFLGTDGVVFWGSSGRHSWSACSVCDVFVVRWISQHCKSRGFTDRQWVGDELSRNFDRDHCEGHIFPS